MRTSLGVSAGSEVVCSALLTTSSDGAQSFETRMISADEPSAHLSDLVSSSIELMTTQVGDETVQPSGIAVAYRTEEQTRAIRSAVGSEQRDLQLVPESAAALAYLRHTGEVARFETVAIADFGASGLTVTVLDQVDGTVHDSRRSGEISGDAIDETTYRHLVERHRLPAGSRPNRAGVLSRVRTAKEHLSSHDTTTVEYGIGQPRRFTRTEFEQVAAPFVAQATAFVARVVGQAPHRPDALILIGGGANMPAIAHGLSREFSMPVLRPTEPEAVIAKGAALVADSTQPLVYPVVSMQADAPISTFTKVAGAILGAFVVVGLIVGYGVQTLSVSTDDNVSPAATLNRTDENAMAGAPTTQEQVLAPTGGVFPTFEFSETNPAPPMVDPSPGSLVPPASDGGVAPRDTATLPSREQPTQSPAGTISTTSPTTTTSAPPLHPAPDLQAIPWPSPQRPERPGDSEPSTPTPEPEQPAPAPTQP
ncbi:MAG: Hsp70 family protein, partial [Aldersonia sp.]|nr:Hsp70 family protein [Aldersonia sp.]